MLERKEEERENHRLVILVLLAIIAIGVLLRLLNLGGNSLWNDELVTWRLSRGPSLASVIRNIIPAVGHPPAYQIPLYFVEKYLGDSEYLLRLPSAISGIISLLVIFLLARLLYSSKEGLIAAALMAVLWCPIYYSQEARPYAMLLLFSLITAYLWITMGKALYVREKPKRITLIFYVISAIICCYLHHFGILLVVFQAGYLLVTLGKRPKALVSVCLLYLPVFLALFPWMTVVMRHWNKGPVFWLRRPQWTAFASYLGFIYNRSKPLLALVLVIYSLAGLKFLFGYLRQSPRPRLGPWSAKVILTAWLLIPFAVVFLISLTAIPVLNNRYLIIVLPPAYLLLARSITYLVPRRKKTLWVILPSIVLVVFLGDLFFVRKYYTMPQKEQFREAVNYIINNNYLYPNSLVIGHAWSLDYFDYYFERAKSQIRVDLEGGSSADIPGVKKAVASQNPSYIWFVYGHRWPQDQFMAYLNGNFEMLDKKTFRRAGVYLYGNQSRSSVDLK